MANLISKGIFILLLFLGFFSNDSLCQNSPNDSDECDTAVFCSYNRDNLIYLANKEFTFLLKTTVVPEDFRYYERPYPLDKFQEKIILKLKILPGCFFDQTKVRYEYFINDSLFNFETTGLIEDKKSVWIHPPRSLIDEVEYSPFFEYKFGQSKWRNAIIMANANPKISIKKIIWARNKYTVINDSLFRFKDEVIKCKKIKIRTRHKGKNFYSTMLFSERIGFVWIDVQFINGKRYSLELIGVEQNYCKEKLPGLNSE